jgi:hypothetical protein
VRTEKNCWPVTKSAHRLYKEREPARVVLEFRQLPLEKGRRRGVMSGKAKQDPQHHHTKRYWFPSAHFKLLCRSHNNFETRKYCSHFFSPSKVAAWSKVRLNCAAPVWFCMIESIELELKLKLKLKLLECIRMFNAERESNHGFCWPKLELFLLLWMRRLVSPLSPLGHYFLFATRTLLSHLEITTIACEVLDYSEN